MAEEKNAAIGNPDDRTARAMQQLLELAGGAAATTAATRSLLGLNEWLTRPSFKNKIKPRKSVIELPYYAGVKPVTPKLAMAKMALPPRGYGMGYMPPPGIAPNVHTIPAKRLGRNIDPSDSMMRLQSDASTNPAAGIPNKNNLGSTQYSSPEIKNQVAYNMARNRGENPINPGYARANPPKPPVPNPPPPPGHNLSWQSLPPGSQPPSWSHVPTGGRWDMQPQPAALQGPGRAGQAPLLPGSLAKPIPTPTPTPVGAVASKPSSLALSGPSGLHEPGPGGAYAERSPGDAKDRALRVPGTVYGMAGNGAYPAGDPRLTQDFRPGFYDEKPDVSEQASQTPSVPSGPLPYYKNRMVGKNPVQAPTAAPTASRPTSPQPSPAPANSVPNPFDMTPMNRTRSPFQDLPPFQNHLHGPNDLSKIPNAGGVGMNVPGDSPVTEPDSALPRTMPLSEMFGQDRVPKLPGATTYNRGESEWTGSARAPLTSKSLNTTGRQLTAPPAKAPPLWTNPTRPNPWGPQASNGITRPSIGGSQQIGDLAINSGPHYPKPNMGMPDMLGLDQGMKLGCYPGCSKPKKKKNKLVKRADPVVNEPSALAKGLTSFLGLARNGQPDSGLSGLLRSHLNPEDATDMLHMPWAYGAAIPALAGGLYAGWKPADMAFDHLRKSDDEAAIEDAKKRYEEELRQQALAKAGEATLDSNFEKLGTLEPYEGLLAAIFGTSALGTGAYAYNQVSKSNSAKVMDEAIKQRQRELMMRSPKPFVVKPVPVYRNEVPQEDEEDINKERLGVPAPPPDLQGSLR